MKKHPYLLYPAIIAICFLYTGSAYMSQSFRLMDFYSGQTVDIITSTFNYFFQGAGILLFSLGLSRYPDLFGKRKLFVYTLIAGSVFLCLMQLSNSGLVVQTAGYAFNLLVGIYFGFYLTMLSKNIPPGRSGISFGIAYAIASVGTYFLSLLHGGSFLVSKEITVIYLIMAGITIALVLMADDLDISAKSTLKGLNKELKFPLLSLVFVIIIITIIFSIGSGLYYSLPVAESVNWNLIRAFYAAGLILSGFIMDRSRLIGEILAIASLTYPLIMLSLAGNGVTNTVTLGISYVVRGFITIYYVTAFTDIGYEHKDRLFLAPAGLMFYRFTEALISLFLIAFTWSEISQLIFAAVLFIPLLILFITMQSRKYSPEPMTDAKRFAMFSERFGLTSREMEILKCLTENMSDSEIAEKYFISKNTVRFHISNLLKKTGTASRVEVVQALNKF